MNGQIASSETISILISLPTTQSVRFDSPAKPVWLKINHIVQYHDGATRKNIKFLYLGRPANEEQLISNKDDALEYLKMFHTPLWSQRVIIETRGYVVGPPDFEFPTVFERITSHLCD